MFHSSLITYHPTNVSWPPTGDSVQMNNVLCPICKEECYNTWGLIEHMNQFHPKRSPEDLLAATWEDIQQVLAEAEAIIAGCCPCCGSSNVQSSTQNGVRIYTCGNCGHEWEG